MSCPCPGGKITGLTVRSTMISVTRASDGGAQARDTAAATPTRADARKTLFISSSLGSLRVLDLFLLRWSVPRGLSSSYLLVLKCLRDCCGAPDDAREVGTREWAGVENTSGPKEPLRLRPHAAPPPVFRLTAPHHDYLLILLLKSNTRRFTIQIEVTHQFINITHHHEYQLAATEGVRADCAPSEFFPCRGAIIHHAIRNERAGARTRGAARIPTVRPHDPQGRAHRFRHQVPP